MTREDARQEIKRHISCADYLERSKSGMYCCPFCGSGMHGTSGSDGALKLYQETNTWNCFSCGRHGDVLDLITERTGADHNTAILQAAESLGLSIDGYSSQPASVSNAIKEKANSTGAPSAATQEEQKPAADYRGYFDLCEKRLQGPEGKAGVSYLNGRGISLQTAAALHIGFDPEADPASAPGAMDSTGKRHTVPRIIIPTSSSHYVGRRIDGEKSFAKMNPKDGTPGIFNAAAIYSGAAAVYVTEGAFDAMSIAETGRAAVALNSTNNGQALIKLLEREPAPAGTVFLIAFDNDGNPDTAAKTKDHAEKLRAALEQHEYKTAIVNITGSYKDANEALQGDRTAFESMLEQAEAEPPKKKDFLTRFLEKIQSEAYRPIETGLSFFDDFLGGGVIPQSILILMAAPGTGKTTLCQQLGEAMAERGRSVVYINLEMSAEQMTAKSISRRLATGGIYKTATGILQGYNWSQEEREAILQEFDRYRDTIYPFMRYNPGNTGSDLDSILKRLEDYGNQAKAAGVPGPVVILDYLHLISSAKNMETAELIKQAITGLKSYAVAYNTFCIAIAATNRTSNSSGKITMESGRDSSNIEYTGDYQIGMNFWEYMGGTALPGESPEQQRDRLLSQEYREMGLQLLKNRFGAAGKKEKFYFRANANLFLSELEYMNETGSTADLPPAWVHDDDQQPTVWSKGKKNRR